MNKLINWINGLVGAVIAAGATGITVAIQNPEAYNLQAGKEDLITVIIVNAIVGAALYLKTKPTPFKGGEA